MKVEAKYKKPYNARYNPLINRCVECGIELWANNQHGSIHKHIYGFAETNVGMLAMIECPKCGDKWSFHARENEPMGTYERFILAIDTNIHF